MTPQLKAQWTCCGARLFLCSLYVPPLPLAYAVFVSSNVWHVVQHRHVDRLETLLLTLNLTC